MKAATLQVSIATLLLIASIAPESRGQTTVFSSKLDSALPAQITPGHAKLEGVQGYAGLGKRSTFGGKFLRSPTGNVVTLKLTKLPPHTSISIDFLFAAIDSLDGVGSFPSGDFFRVTLDGKTIFREAFANALPSQVQTYAPPAGVQLARRKNLGFSGPGSYYTDSAYDLGADPYFAEHPHSGSTATLTFRVEGPGIQKLNDESWAMDNLAIRVRSTPIGSVTAFGLSCGPKLDAVGTPRLGARMTFRATNLHTSTVATFLALGLQKVQGKLDTLGLTRCWMLQDFALVADGPMHKNGSSAALAFTMPKTPSLAGAQFYAQAWSVAPKANRAGLQTSGGLRIVIGR